jgi:hypothetical protein
MSLYSSAIPSEHWSWATPPTFFFSKQYTAKMVCRGLWLDYLWN